MFQIPAWDTEKDNNFKLNTFKVCHKKKHESKNENLKLLENGQKNCGPISNTKNVKRLTKLEIESRNKRKTKIGKSNTKKEGIEIKSKNKSNFQPLKNIANSSQSKLKMKQAFAKILECDTNHRSLVTTRGNSLRQRMMKTLKAAQFRYINEKLYLSDGQDALNLFKKNPDSFKVYHEGFRLQVNKWPVNPLDILIKDIIKLPKTMKIADLGCGDGVLAQKVPHSVRSFDLVSSKPHVEACDMAHTPLITGEMDIAVYCLALMGTNLKEYLIEANRILKVGGIMKVGEVESRFDNLNTFVKSVERFGFQVTKINDRNKLFYFLDFKKIRNIGKNKSKLPVIQLKPCLYKKR